MHDSSYDPLYDTSYEGLYGASYDPLSDPGMPLSAAPSSRQRRAPSSGEGIASRKHRSAQDYSQQVKKRKRKRNLLIVLVAVLAIVLGGVGAAFAYIQNVSNNLHQDLDPALQDVLVKTDMANAPFYMVLMGTDGSAERDASGEFGDSYRSDSLMLARIDPVQKKITLISIERDTMVDMGEYGTNKINEAYTLGGPSLTVQVVSQLAGVPISQFAEVNFDGFRDIVNTLGGVEVNVPIDIDDPLAGGSLSAGMQTLDGDQALILCRSRHAYDAYGGGDYYRAANQRLVLAAIAKKLLSSSLPTMAATVNTMSSYITTSLDISDIIGLAQAFRGLDPTSDIYSAMQPTTSQYTDGVWFDTTDEAAWATMMQRVEAGLPPTEEDIVDPTGTILANAGAPSASGSSSGDVSGSSTGNSSNPPTSVMVKNGSGLAGVASAAGGVLQNAGYSVETGNADDYAYDQTLVVYSYKSQASEAQNIVSVLGVGTAILNDGTYAFDTDFLVVIGSDY